MSWHLEEAFYGSQDCNTLLARGWEPFAAVSGDAGYVKVLFRREHEHKELNRLYASQQNAPEAGS